MKIYGWRKLFDAGVLLDAKSYVGDDSVACVTREGLVHGRVTDDREYTVDIHVDGKGTVQSMMCSCGYDGCCSHMAAVLYKAESNDRDMEIESEETELPDCMGCWEDRTGCSEEDEERLLSTLEQMAESQLRTALYRFGKRSSFLRENLITRYSKHMDPKIASHVVHMVYEAENEFKDEYNRDYIRDEEGYVGRIEEILDRFIPGFIDEKLFNEAADITISALQAVGWNYLSDMALKEQFGYVITGYWKSILSKGDVSCRKYLLGKIREVEHDDGNDSFVVESCFEFRNSCCDDREYIRELIEERLSFIESVDKDDYDEWYFADLYNRSTAFIVDRLFKGYLSKDELVDFAGRYCKSRMANEKILEYYRGNGLEAEELELLLLILSSDNMDYDYREIYTKSELDEISERTYYLMLMKRSNNEVAGFLIAQILDSKRYFLTCHFSSLKNYLDKDVWEDIIGRIHSEVDNRKINIDSKLPLLKFMLSEGSYDTVFEKLEKGNLSIKAFNSLCDSLFYEDEDRTFKLHKKGLRSLMHGASSRRGYITAIGELENVRSLYDDGESRAVEVAEEWKESYPDRVTMLEELERAGY